MCVRLVVFVDWEREVSAGCFLGAPNVGQLMRAIRFGNSALVSESMSFSEYLGLWILLKPFVEFSS